MIKTYCTLHLFMLFVKFMKIEVQVNYLSIRVVFLSLFGNHLRLQAYVDRLDFFDKTTPIFRVALTK